MECEEFVEGYSSYRDDRMEPSRRERFRGHLESCSSCARYHRVLEKGTEVLRDLPRPEPSPDFLSRLRHRLYHVRDGIPMQATRGGATAAVAVAAVGLLAFAWLPFATQVSVEVELPAVAVETPEVRRTAGAQEGPRFFEPRMLRGQEASQGSTTGGWYGPGLWSGSMGRSAGFAALRTPPSFLAATGTPVSTGR